ncbi:MAG: class I SAM-dependent methyltransferase [Acidobacteria bacterium]|nr:class I SAM-dependent methyltransferase [Acidobacteriota bacterium]
MSRNAKPDTGAGTTPGSRHYRAFVGDTQTYDIFSHMQFSLMTLLGLRQEHTLLDIGCGSLRAGKLFLVYLLPERYFGIEPERWLVEEGIDREIGSELAALKKPRFLYEADFPCSGFGVQFDFVLAQSIFSHASLSQIKRCLNEVRKSLKPHGLFAASFVESDHDYEGDAWVYPDTVRYRVSTIEQLAVEAGLKCRKLEWFHIGGQTWMLFHEPDYAFSIDSLATMNQIVPLKEEMTHYRMRSERLERIERHPLFRMAASVRRFIRRR